MDQIIINNLECFGYHGVFEEESFLGQKFVVDAVLCLDTRDAGKSDDLNQALDYGQVCTKIKTIVEQEQYALIEALAENIASQLLLEFEMLTRVKITVKKPWAPVRVHLDTVAVSIERSWHNVYLSIGSNMGDKEGFLDFAIDQLNALSDTKVLKVSDYIVTKPYGDVEQEDFLNGALLVHTLQTPMELLDSIHEIEKGAHRERLVHWGPRTLDIDILFYDDEVIMEDTLVVPHVEIAKRSFVLDPLSQIAPYYIHPVYKKSILELRDAVEKE